MKYFFLFILCQCVLDVLCVKSFLSNANNRSTRNNGRTNVDEIQLQSFAASIPQASACQKIIATLPHPETGCCGIDINDGVGQAYKSYNFLQQGNNRIQRQSITIENRIAGGRETRLGQFPWLVLIETTFSGYKGENKMFCGGSLITSQFVLTAAHCLYNKESSVKLIEITLAEHDRRTHPGDCSYENGGRKCVTNIKMLAANFILHPNYEDYTLHNDIALVKLDGIAPYTDSIRPICLPPEDIDRPNYANTPLYVAGWGKDVNYDTFIKQWTVINLVPHDQCKGYYRYPTRLHVCATSQFGQAACPGDSGGPLMTHHEGKYYLSGTVSGKRQDVRCDNPIPSIYANVYHYLDWIRAVVGNG